MQLTHILAYNLNSHPNNATHSTPPEETALPTTTALCVTKAREMGKQHNRDDERSSMSNEDVPVHAFKCVYALSMCVCVLVIKPGG